MAINSVNNALYNTNLLFGTANNQKQDSIAKLWSGYNSFQSNAATSAANLTEINTNLKALLASYDDAKNAFSTEFDDSMSALAESADKLKTYDFNVEKDGAITNTTSTDDKGVTTTTTTYSKDLQAAIDTVKGFVDNYNDAIKFFGDYSSVSKRIEQIGTTFGDTTYRASAYEAIGLNVNSDGSFTINESKLADAIVNSPEKVSSTLGEDGLAGKTESHLSFANGQKDNLFPSAQRMLGDQLNTAAAYTGKNFTNISAINNMGNLINMMF